MTMTCSELFMPCPNSTPPSRVHPLDPAILAVTAVTPFERAVGLPRGLTAASRFLSNGQLRQWLGASMSDEDTGNPVGAGAGATPVFVAAIRHDTFLARMGSLAGRSRSCPSNFIANPNA